MEIPLDYGQNSFLFELDGFLVRGLFKEAIGGKKMVFRAPQAYLNLTFIIC